MVGACGATKGSSGRSSRYALGPPLTWALDDKVMLMVGRILLVGCWQLSLVFSAPASASQFLWQTNSAGNDIHVYELNDYKLRGRLVVGPEPHGIAVPADARVVYVSVEANGLDHGELLWIDPRSLAIEHRISVGREPHAIATTPDGRWVYVPCRDGHYWVVDAAARKVVAKIHTGGRPHNTQASRDGRYMYLSPMGAPHGVTVVDVSAGHQVVGFIPFSDSVRPSALSADGRFLFQHVDGLNGFEVAEVGPRRLIATVKHSKSLGWFMPIKRLGYLTLEGFKRCHGLALRPDQEEVWSTCGEALTVHSAHGPAYSETHFLELKSKGYWLTFSPDSRYAFVALSDRNEVAVVDAVTKRVARYLSVGEAPKRNIVLEVPDLSSNKALQRTPLARRR